MLRKLINGTTLRGIDGIDRTLNAVTLSEEEKKKIGELEFLPNDILMATEVKAVVANDKIGITEAEVSEGLKTGKWLPIMQGKDADGNYTKSITNTFSNSITADYAYVEGSSNSASGTRSHAEGSGTNAKGQASHAEGNNSRANGVESHAEGHYCVATGYYSHSEGNQCNAIAENSHCEGYSTSTNGINSHAEGDTTTTTTAAEHAEGKYNYSEKDMFISTIGVGGKDDRKNGVAVGVTGEVFIIGVGGYEGKSNASAKSIQSLIQSYETRIAALEAKLAE